MMIGSCYFSRCAPAFLTGSLQEPAQNKCYSVRPSLAKSHCVSTRKDLVFISLKWGSVPASFVNFSKKWVIPWWLHQTPKQPSSSVLEGLACKLAELALLKTGSPGRSAHLDKVGQNSLDSQTQTPTSELFAHTRNSFGDRHVFFSGVGYFKPMSDAVSHQPKRTAQTHGLALHIPRGSSQAAHSRIGIWLSPLRSPDVLE